MTTLQAVRLTGRTAGLSAGLPPLASAVARQAPVTAGRVADGRPPV